MVGHGCPGYSGYQHAVVKTPESLVNSAFITFNTDVNAWPKFLYVICKLERRQHDVMLVANYDLQAGFHIISECRARVSSRLVCTVQRILLWVGKLTCYRRESVWCLCVCLCVCVCVKESNAKYDNEWCWNLVHISILIYFFAITLNSRGYR